MRINDFSRTGFALVAAWCSALVAQLVIDEITLWLMPQLFTTPYYYWVMYIISVYIVSVPLFVFLCGGRGILRPVDGKMKITVKDFIRLIIVCISLTYVFNIVGIVVNSKISEMVGYPVANPLQVLDSTDPVMMFICTCLITPFTEEIMFRGVMLKKLRPYGDKMAIWFSAMAFGLYHGNFSQLFYAAALGLVFGAIAVKTNRLIYTILLHIAVNISGSVIFPGIAANENELIAVIGQYTIIALIIYGIILAVKMLPHLKTGEPFRPGDIRLMVANPGVISFLILCFIMFQYAIFA